jgi:hypothetical protein
MNLFIIICSACHNRVKRFWPTSELKFLDVFCLFGIIILYPFVFVPMSSCSMNVIFIIPCLRNCMIYSKKSP